MVYNIDRVPQREMGTVLAKADVWTFYDRSVQVGCERVGGVHVTCPVCLSSISPPQHESRLLRLRGSIRSGMREAMPNDAPSFCKSSSALICDLARRSLSRAACTAPSCTIPSSLCQSFHTDFSQIVEISQDSSTPTTF